MPVNLQHLQHAVNATKTEQMHFQSPCAVSGIQNNFNPTRNSESARRNAPDSVHGGEIRDIKCETGQPTVHVRSEPRRFTAHGRHSRPRSRRAPSVMTLDPSRGSQPRTRCVPVSDRSGRYVLQLQYIRCDGSRPGHSA